MDLTKLWGSTLKTLPTEQEWEDLMVADSILCMASGQVDDTQKFYFYATDIERHLYLVEASITKSSKRLACVFKASSKKNATMSNLESFIVLFQNRIVGYLTRIWAIDWENKNKKQKTKKRCKIRETKRQEKHSKMSVSNMVGD